MRAPFLAAFAAVLAPLAACAPARLDGFLYDPLPAPAGGYTLSTAVIPAHEDLRIATPDGQTLHAVFVAASPAGRRPDVTLLYFHGQSNNIGTSWTRMEYLYPLGCNLAIVDPRGYGESTGTPSEAGIQLDEEAALQAIVARPDVAGGKIVIYGRSFGAALAIDLAARVTPAALVTESAFTSVAALVSDGAYVDLPRSFVADSVWDNLAKIPRVPAPYLALHGTADPYVQPRYSRQLTDAHAAAGFATQLVLVPGADHDDVPETMTLDTYRTTLSSFIDSAAPAPAAAPPASSSDSMR
ncbi:MAG TPA: dienelactone hydrolase family protein [Polyangia bacterium]|nr:dienelactone hydrolase family protein [Polyangia bacterium]